MSANDRKHRQNLNLPGHAHELTFSVYRRYEFLKAERTCLWLVDAINSARSALEFSVFAYVFMPDHAHLVVWPRRSIYDISAIRAAIKEPVGRLAVSYLATNAPEWLPRITRRRGKKTERLFWQSGGG